MGRAARKPCSTFYRKLVWRDGYNESKGLPSASQGYAIPASCGKRALQRLWHAGYNAGQKEAGGNSLANVAVDVAANLAREAGVDGAFAKQLASLAKYSLSLLS